MTSHTRITRCDTRGVHSKTMKSFFLINIFIIMLLCSVGGEHLVVGNVANRVSLAHQEHVEYNAFPFIKRVKYYFFPGIPGQDKKIQGIQALDNLHSKASINITAGGVGQSFVNFRMKSERGVGLDYNIGIYVSADQY